jgi:hypothetical protein
LIQDHVSQSATGQFSVPLFQQQRKIPISIIGSKKHVRFGLWVESGLDDNRHFIQTVITTAPLGHSRQPAPSPGKNMACRHAKL